MADRYDVIIIGAGPAGLSAALVLGRACRRVLVCDRGTPRSWATKQMHAFVSRDGVHPQAFRNIARRELEAFANVDYREAEVTDVARSECVSEGCSFTVSYELSAASSLRFQTATARKVLIATGVFDYLPKIEGIDSFFGKSAFPCPYCDGWEFRNQPAAVYGVGQRGFEMARALTAWSSDIVLCSNGPADLDDTQSEQLSDNGIRVVELPIERLLGSDGRLEAILFANGERLARSVLFFDTPSRQQSQLAARLGCEFADNGKVERGQYEATSVPGVFAAGNIIADVQLSIVAAAEGARAAFGINRALTREDFDAKSRRHSQPPA